MAHLQFGGAAKCQKLKSPSRYPEAGFSFESLPYRKGRALSRRKSTPARFARTAKHAVPLYIKKACPPAHGVFSRTSSAQSSSGTTFGCWPRAAPRPTNSSLCLSFRTWSRYRWPLSSARTEPYYVALTGKLNRGVIALSGSHSSAFSW